MSEIRPPMPRRGVTPEQVENSQLIIFFNYLKNLGLKEDDLKDKNILDIGASGGSFGDIAVRFGAKVVSVDSARPKDWQDVMEGDSRKLFEVSAENLTIGERLGLKQEPKFDYVLSHFSVPYVIVNEEQDRSGHWKNKTTAENWHMEMLSKVKQELSGIINHLVLGGKAILYPLFLHLDNEESAAVDFTHGEKRDVREFNNVVHQVLQEFYLTYKDSFDFKLEAVAQKNGTNFTRLIIVRKK